MPETDWDQYFHPKLSGNDKPEFDWAGWVEEHVAPQDPATSKKWKGDNWVPNDYKLAGKAAKDMHDMLAGDDENRTEDSSTHGLGCPPEIAKGLSLLTLYDLVMLLGECHTFSVSFRQPNEFTTDDSTSMTFKEKEDPSDDNNTTARARKDTLLRVLEDVCTTYECCGKGIISVKFFNARTGWGNVDKNKFHKKKFTYKCQGITRIGSELKRKIVDQYVFKSGFVMPKPLLVIVITDGKVFVTLKVRLWMLMLGRRSRANRKGYWNT
jgi:hypothetical protein